MITGSLVAMVTPMCADNLEVDWNALEKLVEWHIEQGTNAIVAVGTTGESATLDVQEHVATIAAVVEQAGGRVPVIAGTGANCTNEAIELTRAAQQAGADACLSVTPYYNKPTQEGLYLHHKTIAEAVDIPQILYNVPGRTACDMLPDTVRRLASVPGVIGIKEATGDMARARELINSCPEGFAIYSGDDETAVELMIMGGHGNISVTANVAPRQIAEMCKLAMNGDEESASQARAIHQQLLPVHKAMFLESNPIPVKWAVAELGHMQHAIRLPMTELAEPYRQQVRSALVAAGLL
ncbi:MAG: 4-hydroxy-tetrahydrodipicolinate synthase [Porticoccaceae bacterium]|nr:4-hydroxy-tetrahydrodipicolinate synthase [Pseudomonadales bacterium]MCP5171853.1 4-hydroxy-tetrahydrodipicolinate synthase [Pseudomonadales bacterium]